MSIFLAKQEGEKLKTIMHKPPCVDLFWCLYQRAGALAEEPGLCNFNTTQKWWHSVFDYVSNVAMMYALKPSQKLGTWLRCTTLEIARQSEADWIGPWFRNHEASPPVGHLETAHMSWSVAVALDLAPDVFSESEKQELEEALRVRAIPLCRAYVENTDYLTNWTCILNAGVALAAAVLGDKENMDFAAKWFNTCCDLFQDDGSYGESLQYANYAQIGLFLTYEALVRADGKYAEEISPERYARGVRWSISNYLYHKPLDGWGQLPRARSVNFNDSAAIFQPTGDLLLHVSSRCKDSLPQEAALARWMFDRCYVDTPLQEPNDLGSFGFVNITGFLTLPLLANASEAKSPQQAGLGKAEAFGNGDYVTRDGWDGKTVLAMQGAGDPLHVICHRHASINSIVLAHNKERMLADPGHSCYRSFVHGVEMQTHTHNTCTFNVGVNDSELRQEDRMKFVPMAQKFCVGKGARPVVDGVAGDLLEPYGKKLLVAGCGEVSVLASDAAAIYDEPINCFERFCILCGGNAVFVIDNIKSSSPLKTTWNWVLNNRDGSLDLKPVPPDRLVARRGNAGMKMFHLAGGNLLVPEYGFMHDAYHPLPAQRGEGKPGSGMVVRWQAQQAAESVVAIHAIALDKAGAVAAWHLKEVSSAGCCLEGLDEAWSIKVSDNADEIKIQKRGAEAFSVSRNNAGEWSLSAV